MTTERPDPFGVASTLHALGESLGDAETLVGSPTPSGATGVHITDQRERYAVYGQLGEGGMGVVERVYDLDLMRELAVKRLRTADRSDPEMQRQFLWEARVAAHLDHPNIVPVHDIGLGADGGIFFTMKLVDGESLEDALAKVARNDEAALLRFALPRRLRIFVQVAQAVAFAHARGVLHRDLKPANVMLGPHGEVYVTDWGIAVLGGDASPPARLAGAAPQAARGVSGTPKYMSPEQAAGEPLDVPSDIYSLGAMLFETIALAPAIEGHSVTDVIERVKRGERKPLGEVCPDVSSSLAAIVERAMALDPRDRYGNVQELIIDVERVLDGLTPSAEKASLVTRAWRSYQARDHALSQLRVMDVDFMVGSGWFVGMAMGLWATRFIPEWTAWIALAGAVAIGVPPTRRWLRARKRGATL